MSSQHDADCKIVKGAVHLCNNLYLVPFGAIRTPDSEEVDGQYAFRNPRTLVESGTADLLDKKLSLDLRESIKRNTLLNPLVCRWVYDESDDTHHPVIVGGERRYRALDFLIRRKELVRDPREPKKPRLSLEAVTHEKVTADVAYAVVPCQVYSCEDDLEALALSWAENKTRINLTDGHEIAEVIKLRQANATDDKIMQILQQDRRWLAETDRLIASLDANTLSDLMEGRIDRTSAVNLARVDPEVRDQVRERANSASRDVYERRAARLDSRIGSAEARVEVAQANAVISPSEETRRDAARTAAESGAEINTLMRRKSKLKPQTTGRQVLRAAEEVTGSSRRQPKAPRNESSRSSRGNDQVLEEMRNYLTETIRKNGRIGSQSNQVVAQVDALRLVLRVINENLSSNNGDLESTLLRHYGSR